MFEYPSNNNSSYALLQYLEIALSVPSDCDEGEFTCSRIMQILCVDENELHTSILNRVAAVVSCVTKTRVAKPHTFLLQIAVDFCIMACTGEAHSFNVLYLYK